MPRGTKQNQQREWESPEDRRKKQTYGMNAGFSGWVNFSIPNSEKSVFSEWLSGEDALTDTHKVINDHFRLSVAEDLRDGGYIATAFQRLESSPNAGKMTSQRSGDPITALYKLIYAISRLMPPNWRDLDTGGDDDW